MKVLEYGRLSGEVQQMWILQFLLNFQVLLSYTVSLENPMFAEFLLLLSYGKEGKKLVDFR